MREIKKISELYVDQNLEKTDDSLERFRSVASASLLKST